VVETREATNEAALASTTGVTLCPATILRLAAEILESSSRNATGF